MSASRASRLAILPLPSSPHWVPTTMVAGTLGPSVVREHDIGWSRRSGCAGRHALRRRRGAGRGGRGGGGGGASPPPSARRFPPPGGGGGGGGGGLPQHPLWRGRDREPIAS